MATGGSTKFCKPLEEWKEEAWRMTGDMSFFIFPVLVIWLALQEFQFTLELERGLSVGLSPFLKREEAGKEKFGLHWLLKGFT